MSKIGKQTGNPQKEMENIKMTNLKFYSWKYNIREEKNDWIVFKRLDNAEKEPASLKTRVNRNFQTEKGKK